MARKNAFYAQSGGVTAVINASACGVIETAREQASRLGTIPVVKAIDEQAIAIEDRVDTVLDAVDSRLPDPAKFVLATTRETVKDGAVSVRTLVGLGA